MKAENKGKPSTAGVATGGADARVLKKLRRVPLTRRIYNWVYRHRYGISGAVFVVSTALGIIFSFTGGGSLPSQVYVNDLDAIARRNQQGFGMSTAAAVPEFESLTIADVKRTFGKAFWSKALEHVPQCHSDATESKQTPVVPEEYDVREHHPSCFYPSFTHGNCSSSWATAVAQLISNRACIGDKAKYEGMQMSPQFLLSCDTINRGCEYGAIDIALYKVLTEGIVSTTCFPYRATTTGVKCSDSCGVETPTRLATYCKMPDAEAMKKEIVMNGPIVALTTLYDDFLVHKQGVYQPSDVSRRLVSPEKHILTHAVTVLGWGTDSATREEYWLIQNNFGPSWGEGGFAKIARSSGLLLEMNALATSTPGDLPDTVRPVRRGGKDKEKETMEKEPEKPAEEPASSTKEDEDEVTLEDE